MILTNVKTVLERIRAAENRFKRPTGAVNLLAVSKKCTAEQIIEAYQAGIVRFGESYLQEAELKIPKLSRYPIEWHFIGPVQSNKTSGIAKHFDWVHSIDRLKIAQRLSEQRPPGRGKLNVCIQLNVSAEDSKSGVSLKDLAALVDSVSTLPNIKLRGLMAIPAPSPDFDKQCLSYHLLNDALQCLKISNENNGDHRQLDYNLDTLSMGMSNDLEAAIGEGSTLVRVGSAIFGSRTTKS